MSTLTPFSLPLTAQAAELASACWRELDLVGFDTETTGKYPLTAEICEIAAVKWRNGQVIDTFQTLLKPTQPMGAEVIAIHGITNEMVADAPAVSDKIGEFHEFIRGGILIAHHAPFDLGFVSIEFEKAGLDLPELPVLCSSLLSRKLFPASPNHRLQTLIGYFQLEQGVAHRALDDARACLEVGLRCLEKTGLEAPLVKALEEQGGPLLWHRFSMSEFDQSPALRVLVEASREQGVVDMAYAAGSTPGVPRRVHPLGVVRSLDGDFVVAYCERKQRSQRYYLKDVVSAVRVR